MREKLSLKEMQKKDHNLHNLACGCSKIAIWRLWKRLWSLVTTCHNFYHRHGKIQGLKVMRKKIITSHRTISRNTKIDRPRSRGYQTLPSGIFDKSWQSEKKSNRDPENGNLMIISNYAGGILHSGSSGSISGSLSGDPKAGQ